MEVCWPHCHPTYPTHYKAEGLIPPASIPKCSREKQVSPDTMTVGLGYQQGRELPTKGTDLFLLIPKQYSDAEKEWLIFLLIPKSFN